jgi:hypothetical protein
MPRVIPALPEFVPLGYGHLLYRRQVEAVDQGAALLDEERPGWWEEIDESELRMSDARSCILGQAWMARNGFENGYDAGTFDLFGEDDYEDDVRQRKIEEHGFDAFGFGGAEYDVLANVWIAAIQERREGATATV